MEDHNPAAGKQAAIISESSEKQIGVNFFLKRASLFKGLETIIWNRGKNEAKKSKSDLYYRTGLRFGRDADPFGGSRHGCGPAEFFARHARGAFTEN